MAHDEKGRRMTTDYLTPAETARRLELSRARIIELNQEGKLPAIRTPLGRLFAVAAVDDFAKGRKAPR
jgi:excisionase family DNA binding protein